MSKFPIILYAVIAGSLLSASPALSKKKCPKGYVSMGAGTCIPDQGYHGPSSNDPGPTSETGKPSSGGAGSDSENCPNGKIKNGVCFF